MSGDLDDELIEEIMNTILNEYGHDPEHLENMIDYLCAMFPTIDPREAEERLSARLCAVSPSTSASASTLASISTMKPNERLGISKADWDDALLIDDMHRSVEYLLSMYQYLAYEEVKQALKLHKEPSGNTSPDEKTISSDEVTDALQFHSYKYGPELKEKVIDYLWQKHGALSRDDIADQLSDYFFDHKIATPKKRSRSGSSERSPRGGMPSPKRFR